MENQTNQNMAQKEKSTAIQAVKAIQLQQSVLYLSSTERYIEQVLSTNGLQFQTYFV